MKKDILQKEIISMNDSLAFMCGWLRRIDNSLDSIKKEIHDLKAKIEEDPIVACKKRMAIYAGHGIEKQNTLEKYHRTRKCKNC